MTTTLPSDDADADADAELGDLDVDDAVTDLSALAAYAGVDLGLTSHLDEHGKPKIIERHLIVPPELAALRLDHFVKTQITRLSRTKIQGIIETQLRRLDGRSPSVEGRNGEQDGQRQHSDAPCAGVARFVESNGCRHHGFRRRRTEVGEVA